VQKGTLSLDAVRVQPAPEPTGYGLIVSAINGSIRNQDNALSAPDQAYATIGSSSTILMYMGGPYNAGTLTVYHSATSPSCGVAVANAQGVFQPVGYTTAGALYSTFSSLPAGTEYVAVSCSTLAKKTSFQLDAVQVQPTLP